MSLAIWWIRRDLRLADNVALHTAMNEFSQVLPVFIVDSKLVNSSNIGEKRLEFLWAGLHILETDLRKRGSLLVVRTGDPLIELSRLISKTGAERIYAEADFSPYARSRDKKIQAELSLFLVGGTSLHLPNDVLKRDGTPYTVFSPYMRTWKNLGWSSFGNILPAPERIETPEYLDDLHLPMGTKAIITRSFQPGEAVAHEKLDAFTYGDAPLIFKYDVSRNQVASQGTSQLSPYLRFGMISARQMIIAALNTYDRTENEHERRGIETWINELIWRDFYISILYHFPYVLKRSFRSEWLNIPWLNDKEDFHAWCNGRTGYPIIDAAMRQLINTGWMHNRARMITASFLVKDLLIDWRWGERWFMQNLIDGDPAANNGGWQWTAGTGTDAVPYFRIFNPVLQGKKYDPQGKYVRKWIPELESVPEKYIHEPWKMPLEVQVRANCQIGNDYPHPIVDHGWARERVLDVYRTAKLNSSNK